MVFKYLSISLRLISLVAMMTLGSMAFAVEPDHPICLTNEFGGTGYGYILKVTSVPETNGAAWVHDGKMYVQEGKEYTFKLTVTEETDWYIGIKPTKDDGINLDHDKRNGSRDGAGPNTTYIDITKKFNTNGTHVIAKASYYKGDSFTRTDMTTVDIEVNIFKVDLITPAGDPTNAPADSGVGQNEFTFSTDTNGVLEINLIAEVSPSGLASQVVDDCIFTVDAIAGSTMAWDAANPGGKPTASNDFLLATVRFSGLPAANSAFGAKKAAVLYKSVKCDEESYEVFFPKNAANHPGAGSGTTPNWYYYWAGTAVAGYDITSGTYSYAPGGARDYAEYNGDPINPHYTIHGPASAGHEKYTSAGLTVDRKGIDTLAATLAHEKQHRQTDLDWRAGGAWFGKADSDRPKKDELPDDWEAARAARGFDKTKQFSWRPRFIYGDDEEVWCEINSLSEKGDASKDWANPGKQSKNKF